MIKRKSLTSQLNNYNKLAKDYKQIQLEFFKSHPDTARQIFYGQIDFELKNKKVLDVGCGFGQDIEYFTKKGARVYGIDICKKMIDLTKQRFPKLQNYLSVESFEKLPFANNFFDLIISRYALQWTKNTRIVFIELHRALKPGGYLIFLVPHPFSDFLCQPHKSYFEQKLVKKYLYNDKWIIKEPSHTLTDYFNEFVLKHFYILNIHEGQCSTNISAKHKISKNMPNFLIIKLQKK